jgi:hypothetical protein
MASRAAADHGAPATPAGGDWTVWLLVGGALVAVGLAAWAFLAPERPDASPEKPAGPTDRAP